MSNMIRRPRPLFREVEQARDFDDREDHRARIERRNPKKRRGESGRPYWPPTQKTRDDESSPCGGGDGSHAPFLLRTMNRFGLPFFSLAPGTLNRGPHLFIEKRFTFLTVQTERRKEVQAVVRNQTRLCSLKSSVICMSEPETFTRPPSCLEGDSLAFVIPTCLFMELVVRIIHDNLTSPHH